MADDETKSEFKVSDKRRFVVDEGGKVKKRSEDKAAGKADQAPAKAVSAQEKESAGEKEEGKPEIDLDSCQCEEDYTKLPPIDFISFIFSLSTSTMIFLGILPDSTTQSVNKDLGLAKQHIDLLGMLQEKTANNLTKEEAQFLDQSLYDLRMKFVEICQEK